MISHFKGNKKPQLQKLYQDFLKILEAVGIPTNDLSDRAKEKMVGACLAIGNAKKISVGIDFSSSFRCSKNERYYQLRKQIFR